MEAGKLHVKIGVDLSALRAGLAEAKGMMAKWGSNMESAGSTLTTSLSAPLALAGGLALKLAGDMEKASLSFRVLLKDTKNALILQKELVQFSAQTPFEFKDVQMGAKQLLAYGFAVKDVTKYLRTAGDLAAGMDVKITEVTSALGRLKSGNFGEAFERFRELGIDRTALEGVGLKFDKSGSYQGSVKAAMEGVEKVIKSKFGGMTEALSQSLLGMLATAWDSIQLFLADIGTSISTSFDLKGLLGSFSSGLDSLKAGFLSLSPMVQKFVLGLGGLAIALPPIMAGLGFLTTTILPAVMAGFAAVISPVGLVVAAVVAAAAAIIYHWDSIKAALGNTKIWTALKDIVKSSLGVIVSIVGVFVNAFQGDWTNMWEHAKNIVKYAWNGIVSLMQAGASVVTNMFTKLLGLVAPTNAAKLQGFFDKSIAVYDLAKAKVPPLTNALSTLKDGYDKLTGGATDFGNKAKDAGEKAKGAADRLKATLDAIKYPDLGGHSVASGVGMVAPNRDINTNRPTSLVIPDFAKNIDTAALAKVLKEMMDKAKEQLKQSKISEELENTRENIKQGVEGMFSGWSIPGMKAEMEKLLEMIGGMSEEMAAKFQNLLRVLPSIANGLAAGFEAFGAALVEGKNPFSSFGKSMLGAFGDILLMIGKEMLKQATVLLAASIFTGGALSPVAIRTGIAGGALVAAGGAVKASIPKFAGGYGGAYKPTMMMFGDHPNASANNPEYVLTQDQVKSMLNRAADNAGGGGGGGGFVAETRLKGSDLLVAIRRATTKSNS